MLLWSWVYIHLFKTLLSILLGTCPEVKLLDDMVKLFLIFWITSILFSDLLCHFTFPLRAKKGAKVFTNTCYFLFSFFIVAVTMDLRWNFIVALICILFMISEVEHLYNHLLDICISFSEKCQFNSFSISCSFFIVFTNSLKLNHPKKKKELKKN